MNGSSSYQPDLARLAAGDGVEFTAFVEAYSSRVFRLARRIVGNEQDAEDVLQLTFLKAYQNLPGFEGRSSLSTWLFRIAINEALQLLRKNKPELGAMDLEESPGEDGPEKPETISDWCCLPEDEYMTQEAGRELDRAVGKLPETLRVVFLLRDIEGLSIDETAQALSLSETAVKTRLLRARLRLREILSQYFNERMIQRQNDHG